MGIEEGGESCTFLKNFGHIFSENSFGHYKAEACLHACV